MRVVVATRNRGKLQEIVLLLRDLNLDLCPIDDLAPDAELREDADTFEDNALAKARQAAAITGLPAIADDSGLEVDALGGAPGVRSARYASDEGYLPAEEQSPLSDDARNNAKLLEAMKGVPEEKRTARYRCVAAFVDPARAIELCRAGSCEGEIRAVPRGGGGFGYDPLFQVPGLGKTMAELTLDEKNQLSHRAAAFRSLAAALTSGR
jgi:XTP/dITP diphosphohydrolase